MVSLSSKNDEWYASHASPFSSWNSRNQSKAKCSWSNPMYPGLEFVSGSVTDSASSWLIDIVESCTCVLFGNDVKVHGGTTAYSAFTEPTAISLW